jgi:hypothetical protein
MRQRRDFLPGCVRVGAWGTRQWSLACHPLSTFLFLFAGSVAMLCHAMVSAIPSGQNHYELVFVRDVAIIVYVVDGSQGNRGEEGGDKMVGKREGDRETGKGGRRVWEEEDELEEEGGGGRGGRKKNNTSYIPYLVFPSFVPPSFLPILSLISSLESLFPPLYPWGIMIHHIV